MSKFTRTVISSHKAVKEDITQAGLNDYTTEIATDVSRRWNLWPIDELNIVFYWTGASI